ncbi:hypothetical protein J3R30DRAFT_3560231 [Lentinula aciculospora]|uniref:ML-like domain-containing protein n=1 Tax=Lentinula aciculospora TaxID=153920 RepID=A0A9W8ZVM6_9AGAR|nr:hypothetical protein J3R30DRAFT_3560231 [Lentinula aciculospora]
MFSFLARLRVAAFTLSSLVISSHALEGSLFTSSVTYCSTPETLLIQQFDVEYFAANQSVSFNISAESVDSNVNVSASLLVNVFGIEPLNITIDLCGILNGALCPLPEYNFTGSDSISLPDSFASNIPSIVFKVPDLEGYAQLTLTEVSTGDVKACVQATLSNGLSTHQLAVEWATGGLTIFTFLVALWQSYSPTTILPYRLMDLIYLFQNVAVSALFNLNYPVTYISFALNFAWSLSLFSSGDDSMQGAINNMRALTGGGLANSSSNSAVAFVNRKLSPFNSDSASSSSSISGLSSLTRRTVDSLVSNNLQQRDVAVVTSESDNVLSAGIPIYVSTINIATANAFMTVFLCTLILIAITLSVFSIGWVSLFTMERFRLGHESRRSQLRNAYPSWVRAWILRLSLIMFTPLVVFAFYQWTLNDSWLSVLFSVIAFLGIMIAVCYPCVVVIRTVRRSEPSVLYTDPFLLKTYGPLHAQYLPRRYHFFLPLVIVAFFKAIIVSFISSSGMAQIILFLILEIALVLRVLLLRPHKTRGADIFSSFLAIVRVVCTGLMIAFIQSIGVKPIPRYAIGLVLAVIYSITILVVFFNIALHIQRLFKRREASRSSSRSSSLHGSSNTMLEKDAVSSSTSDSDPYGRPRNPTPERNVPLDPEINQPYNPSSPTTTTTDYASTRQRDSESTNFGSVLPRRWSFTPLHTPTDSSALDHTPPFGSTLSRTSEEPLEKVSHSHD